MTIQHITSHQIWFDWNYIRSLIEWCLVLLLLHDVTSFLLFFYLLFFLFCHHSSFPPFFNHFFFAFFPIFLPCLSSITPSLFLSLFSTLNSWQRKIRKLDEFRETGFDSWTVFENERMSRVSNRSSSSRSHQSCQWRIWYVRVNIYTYTKCFGVFEVWLLCVCTYEWTHLIMNLS